MQMVYPAVKVINLIYQSIFNQDIKALCFYKNALVIISLYSLCLCDLVANIGNTRSRLSFGLIENEKTHIRNIEIEIAFTTLHI